MPDAYSSVMQLVSWFVKFVLLAALIAAAPLSASTISGKIAKVQRAVAAAAVDCADGECTPPPTRAKLECLAAVAYCASALSAILPASVPALQPRLGAPAVAVEQTGCTVHTALTDPPPPRSCRT
ncbi:hypothetical protein [Acuticoccus sp. I52.16.1]|uniref:hypothetical protein n=1 Tax=Acuticoccus sp. I52.16.1 TaxID=2928472 RepID=UPI001FD43F8D|nr:hypothetical protein [Acuticoccus sp. I52.16.1]UOM35407.1 hypothetical protein MRB58_04155 [Acuticoccus sp. I52.16.1]